VYGNDVFVAESSRNLCFFNESLLPGLCPKSTRIHEFEGDLLVDKAIMCFVYFAHASYSDGSADNVSVVYDRAAFEFCALDGGFFGAVGYD
jgi:hypothetical protein